MKQHICTVVKDKAFSHAMRENRARKVDWVSLHTFRVSVNCSGQPRIWNVIPVFFRTSSVHSFVPSSVLYPFVLLYSFHYIGQLIILWLLLYSKGPFIHLYFLIQILFLRSRTKIYQFALPENFFFFLTRHQHVTLANSALGMGVGGMVRGSWFV